MRSAVVQVGIVGSICLLAVLIGLGAALILAPHRTLGAAATPTVTRSPSVAATATAAPQPSVRPATAAPPTAAQPTLAATPARTAPPTASATPTTPPTASATPTTQSGATARERLSRALATLRSGDWEVAIAYQSGALLRTRVLFQLGANDEARLRSTADYRGAGNTYRNERVRIGATSWERRDDGPWARQAAGGDIREEIATLLPSLPPQDAAIAAEGSALHIRWHDDESRGDYDLVLDERTGQPRTFRHDKLATGTTVTIRYDGWNTPIAIAPPT